MIVEASDGASCVVASMKVAAAEAAVSWSRRSSVASWRRRWNAPAPCCGLATRGMIAAASYRAPNALAAPALTPTYGATGRRPRPS